MAISISVPNLQLRHQQHCNFLNEILHLQRLLTVHISWTTKVHLGIYTLYDIYDFTILLVMTVVVMEYVDLLYICQGHCGVLYAHNPPIIEQCIETARNSAFQIL